MAREIGSIKNYYGGVVVKEEDSKFFWGLTDEYFGTRWEEIPESLFNELVRFDQSQRQTISVTLRTTKADCDEIRELLEGGKYNVVSVEEVCMKGSHE
jgi:hypothetical protein